jgi:hypothetical protein
MNDLSPKAFSDIFGLVWGLVAPRNTDNCFSGKRGKGTNTSFNIRLFISGD